MAAVMRSAILLCNVLPLLLLPASCSAPRGGVVPATPDRPAAAEVVSSHTLVQFCRSHRGKKVGDGECWALANEGFKATGRTRPGADLRVWGRPVAYRREAILPGDILECEKTSFADGSTVPTKHTAVVIQVYGGLRVRIAEQNSAGRYYVTERDLDLGTVRSGRIALYRPS